MSKGWVNDDKNKSVPVNPNVKTHTGTGRTSPGFDTGRQQGQGVRGTGIRRDSVIVTTNQKKGGA
jgi:hypothetical protein